MRDHSCRNSGLLSFATALLASACVRAAPANYELIAATGRQAPGTLAGTTFQSLITPMLNSSGQVAYRATLAGVPFDVNSGVWVNDTLLARKGDVAPGGGLEMRFGSLGINTPVVINDAGVVAFVGNPDVPGAAFASNDRAMWAGTPSNLQLVTMAGMPAPGFGPGTDFRIGLSGAGTVFPNQSPFSPLLSDSGRISFWADVVEAGLRVDTIYAGPASSPGFRVRSESQAHGLPPGVNYGYFGTYAPVDGAGNVLFTAVLDGPGTSSGVNAGATYHASASGVRLVRRDDDPVPGIPGARWSESSGLSMLNESGQTLFESDLRGVAPGTEATLWFGDPFSPTLVARAGEIVPGAPAYRFGGAFDDLYLDDSGRSTFTACADPADAPATGPIALWTGTPGGFDLVLAEGDRAPGTPEGTLIYQLGVSAVNGNGLVLFSATLQGGGATASSNEALFAGTPDGLRLLVREGDFFEVAPGDVRRVSGFDTAARSYLEYQLNDANQVLASFRFTDGSAAIYVVNVPEPGALLLFATPLLLLARRQGCCRR